MLSYLITGTILGLSAGFAPGPLLALVIAETLQHDVKAGIKVALAPILTDIPIVFLSVFALAKLSHYNAVLGIISLFGGFFILYLGIMNLGIKSVQVDISSEAPKSLQKGILVNAFSPHPYLFWLSVGGPITLKAMGTGVADAFLFIASFYILLVGSKVFLAILTGKSRSFLTGRKYFYTMRILGLILIILAGLLFKDGLGLLGVL